MQTVPRDTDDALSELTPMELRAIGWAVGHGWCVGSRVTVNNGDDRDFEFKPITGSPCGSDRSTVAAYALQTGFITEDRS